MPTATLSPQKGSSPPPDSYPDTEMLRKKGLRRLLVSAPVYGAAIVFLGISAYFDVVSTAHWLIVSSAIGGSLVLFYLLLQSGWSKQMADPMLTFPQVVVNIGNVALVYALMGNARAMSLLWLSLIIVFDIQRLAPYQMRVAALLAMALPIIVLVATTPPDISHTVLRDKLIFLGCGSVLVPGLLLVGRQARQVRKRMLQIRQELAAAVDELNRLSRTDGMTGLTNRTHMQTLLAEEERRFQRTHADYSIALLDIDHFKLINDSYGHAVGDAVLRRFAALARGALLSELDVIARWGGEEFLILMPERTQEEACTVLARFRALMHLIDWESIQPGLKVSFSAGIAARSGASQVRELVAQSDEALYRAKRSGRDRIEPPSPPLEGETHIASELPALIARVDTVAAGTSPAGKIAQAVPDPRQKRQRRAARSPLLDVVLGTDEALRITTASVLVAAGVYLVMMMALLHGISAGLISASAGQLLLIGSGIAVVCPFALVRSGMTRNWQDRSLQVPQMLWALLLITIGFVALPAARANIPPIICLVLIFGFINLRPRQTLVVGAAACMLTLIGLALIFAGKFPRDSAAHEILQAFSAVFVFALITALSRNFALLRERMRQERRKLAATAEQIHALAIRDGLTGLANRAHATSALQSELERSDRTDRTGRTFSVALIDLDHFKRVNDTYGHQAGDEVLQCFGQCATEATRATDVVARWGGEEFIIILPEAYPGDNAMLPIERLRARFCETEVTPSAPDLRVTLSAGVATRQFGESLDALIERADNALYLAKKQGRNRCTLSAVHNTAN